MHPLTDPTRTQSYLGQEMLSNVHKVWAHHFRPQMNKVSRGFILLTFVPCRERQFQKSVTSSQCRVYEPSGNSVAGSSLLYIYYCIYTLHNQKGLHPFNPLQKGSGVCKVNFISIVVRKVTSCPQKPKKSRLTSERGDSGGGVLVTLSAIVPFPGIHYFITKFIFLYWLW